MSPDTSIVLAQINPVLGDLTGNADMIAKAAKAHKGAMLIVFPELSICGYPPEDLLLKPCFVEDCMEAVRDLAERTKKLDCGILIGTPWRDNEDDKLPYNAAALLHQGKITDVRFKHHLPNYGVFDEKRTFQSGPLPEPIEFAGHKLGVMICEDMWNTPVAAHLANQGAEMLIVPNGSPFTTLKYEVRLELAKNRATETGLPLIYVNQVGGQDELVFDGGSFAIEADGTLKTQLPFFEEAIQPAHQGSMQSHTENELIYNALKLGLGDYVRKNGFSGVIIGLSGGVDSALTTALAVDALGAKHVHCVMLPSQFTSQDSLDDAAALAKNLGVRLDTISIEAPLKAFEQTLPGLKGLAHENIQSRIRGNILMALSNTEGKMVLTTGNKSEMAVGYATIYGDMNGGFNALKDVYKTKVYALCHWRNDQGAIIPDRIITKAPTAELRENQLDQDSLPPYDVLDGILELLIEAEQSVDDICSNEKFERETVLRIWKLLDRAEYKRYQAAPGTKTTPKAFGRDRRYPMTNRYSDTF